MNVVKFYEFKFLKDGVCISIVGRVAYYSYRTFLQDYNSSFLQDYNLNS